MALGVVGSWVQAAAGASTLAEFQDIRAAGQLIAARIADSNPALAAQLASQNHTEVMRGLAALQADPVLIHTLESGLNDEAAKLLVAQATALVAEDAAPRDVFLPENAAAGQAHTLLQYGLSRLRQVGGAESAIVAACRLASERLSEGSSRLSFLGRVGQKLLGPTQERPETSKYDYDIERARGRFIAHEEAPMAATSEEGHPFFVKTREKELEAIRAYTSKQLALNSLPAQETYLKIRAQVIALNQPYRTAWNAVVLGMRKLGNMPNFRTVSAAYWERDAAIRRHAGLRSRGFGPREYDLFRGRSNLQAKELTGTANDTDRLAVYGGELDYALMGIFKEHEKVSEQPPTEARDTRLKQLETDRFRMERVFTALAQDQPIAQEDSLFLEDVRARYLPYLAPGLDGLDLSDIENLQAQAKAAYDLYSRQMRDRHLELSPLMLSLAVEEQRRNIEIDRLEREWQLARYRDLIDRRRVTKADLKRFENALDDYALSSEEYLSYAEKMLKGDPSARPYEENSKHRAVISSLKWTLHDTVRKILGSNDLEILSFTFKTQAQFFARGDQGIVGLEPIVEVTARLAPVLDRNEKSIYSLREIRGIAGRDWSMGQLSHYAKNVHYIGAEKLIGYFAQEVRPETMILEGAASLYPEGFAELKPQDFAHRSGVRRALHLGQLEFSEAMGSFYQLGLGHVTILAQASVGNFPTAGPFLYGLDRDGHHYLGSGALLDRESGGDRKTHEAFTREINIGMGNNVNFYESGTRDVARSLASPYADLEQYPEAVHLPEYHGTGPNTGMSLRLARKMGVPVIPVAYDLDQVYPEPSMPMPGNLGTNFKSRDPRKIVKSLIKSYGGFWNDRTMLRYVRPGRDDIKVAYGDVMTPESLVNVSDLEALLPQDQFAQIMAIEDQPRRQKALRWQETLHNSAIANFYERVAGYHATAGIYGPESRPHINGRNHFGLARQPAFALRN
jgi:hypothetical protein